MRKLHSIIEFKTNSRRMLHSADFPFFILSRCTLHPFQWWQALTVFWFLLFLVYFLLCVFCSPFCIVWLWMVVLLTPSLFFSNDNPDAFKFILCAILCAHYLFSCDIDGCFFASMSRIVCVWYIFKTWSTFSFPSASLTHSLSLYLYCILCLLHTCTQYS